MNLWTPVPLGLAASPAYRVLDLPARGALLDLYLAAAGGDTVPIPVDMSPEDVAAGMWGTDGPAILRALYDAGMLDDHEDGPCWRLVYVARTRAHSTPDDAADAPASSRPAPSQGAATRATLNRLHAHWSRRGLRAAEARTAWLSTPEGARVLEGLGLALDVAEDAARSAGSRGGRFGLDRPARPSSPTATDGATPAPSDGATGGTDAATDGATGGAVTVPRTVPRGPLPHTPSPEEKEQKESKTQTLSDAGVRVGTVPRLATPDGATVPRCSTVEATGYTSAELLADLRTRAPKAISTGCDSVTEACLARVMVDLVGRQHPDATPNGYRVLADWLAAGGMGWWTQGRPSVAYLARPGTLAKHLDDAAAWAQAGRPKIAHGRGPNADAQGAARPRQDAARGMAPVSPPGSYARKQGEPDALEQYLVQPLHRPTPTGTAA